MPFIKPTFNLDADIFSFAGNFGNPPRLTVKAQLRAPNMNSTTLGSGLLANVISLMMLVDAGTDIRDLYSAPINAPDWVEIPAGSGCRYQVLYVNDVGKGFPNEHRYVQLAKTTIAGGWPVPIP